MAGVTLSVEAEGDISEMSFAAATSFECDDRIGSHLGWIERRDFRLAGITFLRALTDEIFVVNVLFGDPLRIGET